MLLIPDYPVCNLFFYVYFKPVNILFDGEYCEMAGGDIHCAAFHQILVQCRQYLNNVQKGTFTLRLNTRLLGVSKTGFKDCMVLWV